jgi:carbon storage regulator
MLVFTRKEKESIAVRGDIFITVTRVQGDKVKLGIEAPKDAGVRRKEVCEKLKPGAVQT